MNQLIRKFPSTGFVALPGCLIHHLQKPLTRV